MLSGKFFLTVIVITIAISFIQWFFVGFLFHKYQALTPSTWRKENNSSYIMSMILSIFFAFMFSAVFYLWKAEYRDMHLFDAIKFGTFCWLTFSVTIEIGNAIYVNYSRVFVAGKCLSSFLEYTISASIAFLLL